MPLAHFSGPMNFECDKCSVASKTSTIRTDLNSTIVKIPAFLGFKEEIWEKFPILCDKCYNKELRNKKLKKLCQTDLQKQ